MNASAKSQEREENVADPGTKPLSNTASHCDVDMTEENV